MFQTTHKSFVLSSPKTSFFGYSTPPSNFNAMNAIMDFTNIAANSQSKLFPNPLIIHSLKRIKKQDGKNKVPSYKKRPLALKRVEYFLLPRFIEEQHKYFIRGEIVIDVNMIK